MLIYIKNMSKSYFDWEQSLEKPPKEKRINSLGMQDSEFTRFMKNWRKRNNIK